MITFNTTGGWEVIAAMQYPHPNDKHLWLVIVDFGYQDADEPGVPNAVFHKGYGTFVYNAADGGFDQGHYFNLASNHNREKAFADFIIRCHAQVTDIGAEGTEFIVPRLVNWTNHA